MSTQPLLPSYDSATRQAYRQTGHLPPTTTNVVHFWTTIFFIGSTTISTVWAFNSYTAPNLFPPAYAPLMPYFTSLCLLISFGCWIGFLWTVFYDDMNGSRVQRKVIIWTSVSGKLILACMHVVVWYSYKRSFPDSIQPNWVAVFLAVQAWWDMMLFVITVCLRP
ncbi:hypothetical protein AOQ84DRAFT_326356 [Glonium stellatum]|uniref:Uncharacterized protein n=1 Tax=Glonium stellatum TaxID=574774 RepID=A0A8E2EQT6_9PEZI|nr:hypothetical protein AOQ84DRAFT_326356 [Glonium stellatum]